MACRRLLWMAAAAAVMCDGGSGYNHHHYSRHATATAARGTGTVMIKKPVKVLGAMDVNTLSATFFNASGSVSVQGSVTSASLHANTISANVVQTTLITSPTGKITIDADVTMVQSAPAASSFLEQSSRIVLPDVWRLVSHESFDEGGEAQPHWNHRKLSNCGAKDGSDPSAPPDWFLGGHCNIATGELSRLVDSSSLPAHKYVRVTAKLHQIDQWDGQTMYAKLDDRIVWTHVGLSSPDLGIDVCGGSHPESRVGISMDVSVAHSSGSPVKISFGSTGSESDDPCKRSFGVDDVLIYVK